MQYFIDSSTWQLSSGLNESAVLFNFFFSFR